MISEISQQGYDDKFQREVLKTMVAVVGATFRSFHCAVFRAEENLYLDASHTAKWCPPAISQLIHTWWRPVAAQCWHMFSETGPCVRFSELNSLSETLPDSHDYVAKLQNLGARFALIQPIMKEDSVVGLVTMLFDRDPLLTHDQLEILSQLASQLSELFPFPSSSSVPVTTSERRILGLTADLPSDSDLGSSVARILAARLPADPDSDSDPGLCSSVGVLSDGEGVPCLSGMRCWGLGPPELTRIADGRSLDWLAARLQRQDVIGSTPLVITKVDEETQATVEARRWFEEHGFDSIIVVKSERFRCQQAVFMIMSRSPRDWTPAESQLLSTFASTMGRAVIEAHVCEARKQQIAQLEAETAPLRSSKKQQVEQLEAETALLRTKVNQLKAIQDINERVRRSLDMQENLSATAKLVAEVFSIDRCHIRFWDERLQGIISTAGNFDAPGLDTVNLDRVPTLLQKRFLHFNGGKEDALLIADVSIPLYDEVSDGPEFRDGLDFHTASQIASVIIAKTLFQGKPNGNLVLCSKKPRNWTSEEVATLASIANQVGVTLALAQFVQQEKKAKELLGLQKQTLDHQRRRAALLQDIVTTFRDSPHPQASIERTARLVSSFVSASCCFVRQLPLEKADRAQISLPPIWSCSPSDAAVQLVEALTLPGPADQSQNSFARSSGAVSALVAPTFYNDRCNGLIGVITSSERCWSLEEHDLLKVVADHVGIAIAYVSCIDAELQKRVIQQKNQELSSMLKTAEIVRAVVAKIRDSLDINSILETATRLLSQEFGTSTCIVRSVSEVAEGTRPVVLQLCQYVSPGSAPILEDESSPEFHEHLLARILSIKDTTYFPSRRKFLESVSKSEAELKEARQIAEQYHIGSTWSAPTFYRGHMNGLICLFYATERPIRAGEKELLNAVKDQLGMALEHSRLLQHEQEQKELLASKNDALQKATLESQAASRAKSDFLSVISHELRTPMTAVLGVSQLLLQTALTSQQRDLCETIITSGDALVDMICEMLDCNKLEQGCLQVEYSYFRFEEFLEGIVDLMTPASSAKNLCFTYSIDPAVPAVIYSDPRRLRQILTNVIGNALKFTESGTVTIEAWPKFNAHPASTLGDSDCDTCPTSPTAIQIDITDTGPGIDAKDRPRLFQFFQQLDSSKTRRFSGTGIGLYLSKNLILLLGGDLWVDSSPSIGSIFHLTIPLVNPKSSSRHLPSSPPPPQAPASPLPKSCRVVLAVRNRVAAAMIANTAFSLNAQVLRLLPDDRIPAVLPQVTDVFAYDESSENVANQVTEEVLLCKILASSPRVTSQNPCPQEDPSAQLATPLPTVGPALVPTPSPQQTPSTAPLVSLSPSVRLPHKTLYQPLHRSTFARAILELLAPSADTAPTGTREQRRSERMSKPVSQGQSLDVLLAEDNALSAKIVAMMLKKLGHKVDIVADGRAAVNSVRLKRYDLVLMDWMMPDMDGLTACRNILQLLPERSSRPLLSMLTANVSAADRDTCLAAGVDHYLTKPVRMEDLQRIAAICAR